MTDIRRSVQKLLIRGVEAVNHAANHVATTTRAKVDELNLRNNRSELLNSLSKKLYEQWQQGIELPESLTEMLEQLQEIDTHLAELLKQREKEKTPSPETEAAPETQAPIEDEEAGDIEVPAEVEVAAEEKEEPVPSIVVKSDESVPAAIGIDMDVPQIQVETQEENTSEE